MTISIFLGSLLGVMALGVPIAFALLLSGVALRYHPDLFDAQILAQNVINGADSFTLLAALSIPAWLTPRPWPGCCCCCCCCCCP